MNSAACSRNFFIILVCLLMSACGSARFTEGGSSAGRDISKSGSDSCSRETGTRGLVRVCPGDNLTSIAARNNVTIIGLRRENNLPSDRILAGQTLKIPVEAAHIVREGDTVVSIALRYDVPPESIVVSNNLLPPNYIVATDTVLSIPNPGIGYRSSQELIGVAPDGRADAAARTPPDGDDQTVKIGTGATGTTAPETNVANDDAENAVVTAEPESKAEESVVAAAVIPVPKPKPAPAKTAKDNTQKRPSSDLAKTAPPPDLGQGNSKFLLPVQGSILSDFGPTSGGLHNDGINIAAPRGTPIQATADGTIAYAGDGLPGFGNLILIRHSDGWTSAYAHADSMKVKRGDEVKRGETIGQVGASGSVDEPQLHFELRKHDRAVDPKPLLGT